MRLRPWPSPTIAAYTARLFLVRILAFALALIGILQTLDLLTQSSEILAVEGNGNAELIRYVQLRLPQLVSQFLPFSVLLATLVTLASLSQSSEVVIMKGAGISAHAILFPLMATALGVAIFHFAFNELVLVKTNAELSVWQEAEYAREIEDSETARFDVWAREGSDIIRAGRVEGMGMETRLFNVTVDRRSSSRLVEIISAPTGRPAEDGWLLQDVEVFDVREGALTERESLIVGRGIAPERFALETPDPDELTYGELSTAIERVETAGGQTDALKTALLHKISLPLSAVLMPLLGAVAAFGLARSGQLFIRSVIGMALGFAYFVADNFMVAMGEFGAAPPLLAAWAPFLLFFLVGETVLFRTEE